MEASSLSLLTPFPLGTLLGPLLIILQNARGCVPFPSESSVANQDCWLEDTNVEFCAQWEAMLTSHTTLYKDTLLGSSFQSTNHFRFCFLVAATILLFLFWLFPSPHFGVFLKTQNFLMFDTLSFSTWHSDIFIGISYFFQLTPRKCSGIVQC